RAGFQPASGSATGFSRWYRGSPRLLWSAGLQPAWAGFVLLKPRQARLKPAGNPDKSPPEPPAEAGGRPGSRLEAGTKDRIAPAKRTDLLHHTSFLAAAPRSQAGTGVRFA